MSTLKKTGQLVIGQFLHLQGKWLLFTLPCACSKGFDVRNYTLINIAVVVLLLGYRVSTLQKGHVVSHQLVILNNLSLRI